MCKAAEYLAAHSAIPRTITVLYSAGESLTVPSLPPTPPTTYLWLRGYIYCASLDGVASVGSGLISPGEGDGGEVGGARNRQPFVLEVLRQGVQTPVVVLQQVGARFLAAKHKNHM